MMSRILSIVGAAWALSISPVWSHHSHANYVESEWVHLEGTVQEIHWVNPHTWIYLEVVDTDGAPKSWALEGASVTTLRREGWTPDSVKIGDSLSVRCHPLKDGSRGCLMGFVLLGDGAEKEFD